MNRNNPRRLSALLLTLTLLSTPAWAAGGWEARLEPTQGFFAAVWQYLGSLVAGTSAEASTDGRASMDPNGVQTDGRASMDPNG